MKKKQRRAQLTLVTIGFILFALTYLYYPAINKSKLSENEPIIEDFEQAPEDKEYTYFKKGRKMDHSASRQTFFGYAHYTRQIVFNAK